MSCAMFMKSASPVFFTLMYMVFPLVQYPAVYIQTKAGNKMEFEVDEKRISKKYRIF